MRDLFFFAGGLLCIVWGNPQRIIRKLTRDGLQLRPETSPRGRLRIRKLDREED
jgi:hypothetical protein